MNFKKIYSRIRQNIKSILVISFTFFSTVIIPFIIRSEFFNISRSGIDIRDYFERIQLIIGVIIILGGVITGLVIVTCFQRAFSAKHYQLSVLSLSLTCLYIYLWSKIVSFKIRLDMVTIWLNLSNLYIFFLMIPALLIIRKTYIFVMIRKELKYKIYLLKVIKFNKKINSKAQLRKMISNDNSINDLSKDYLLKNLSKIMKEIEISTKPLLIRAKGYRLTKEGQRFYNLNRKISIKTVKCYTSVKTSNINGIEFWTEEELENLSRN